MDIPVGPDFRSLIVAYTLMSHQFEPEVVFSDPILARIVPFRDDPISTTAVGDEETQSSMKLQLALHHRYADDVIAGAVAAGLSQLVVLDAGLNTVAHRRGYPTTRVYEVDVASTQRWKRQNLAASGVGVPATLSYVELGDDHDLAVADFESRGYDFAAATLVVWLDGLMFLPAEALSNTVGWLDRHHGRVELVANYLPPPATAPSTIREASEPVFEFMARTAEPLVTFFEPDRVHDALRRHGFDSIEDIGWAELCARYLPAAALRPDPLGVHVTHATRSPGEPG